MRDEDKKRYRTPAIRSEHKGDFRKGLPELDDVVAGVKRWPLDAAVMAADIADLPYGALKGLIARSGRRGAAFAHELPPMGFVGNAARRGLRSLAGTLPPPRERTEMSAPPSMTEDLAAMANPVNFMALGKALPSMGGLGSLLAAGVIKPKGGQWLSGSVENALSGLKPRIRGPGGLQVTLDDIAQPQYASPELLAEMERVRPLDAWIQGPLTKYVKTRMASPDDEVRKLAEQGIMHYDIPTVFDNAPMSRHVKHGRVLSGFPEDYDLANPDTKALDWERIADSVMRPRSAEEILRENQYAVYGAFPGEFKTLDQAEDFLAKMDALSGGQPGIEERLRQFPLRIEEIGPVSANPWIRNLQPDEVVHDIGQGLANYSDMAGFKHLTDELRNALKPDSGLPRHLQLTPAAMQNLSMEKAVRRVHEINEWRAAQKAEANRKLAEQAAIVREYTENNPKGLRWVELKHDDAIPEGWSVEPVEQGFDVIDAAGNRLYAGKDEAAVKKLIAGTLRARGDLPLEKQLKYEGDVMGHCVGGYCDDVLSGKTRIFSLRDSKGEPHVTVEVAPPNPSSDRGWWSRLTREEQESVMRRAQELGYSDTGGEEAMVQAAREALPSRIVQIKGKQNRKPNDEYLPFVQDFVRNSPVGQPWSDVGDLHNSGLRKPFSPVELDRLRELGEEISSEYFDAETALRLQQRLGAYTDPAEAEAYRKLWRGEGYAEGGSVAAEPVRAMKQNPRTVSDLVDIIAQLGQGH